MVPESEWEWFGTPGHFICGHWCRFHLCTLIGDCLVSTVGEYVHPRHGGGSEQQEYNWLADNWPGEDIGCGRKYETMVFKAGERCDDPKCNCGQPLIKPSELEVMGYNSRGDATKGHMLLCRKWANAELIASLEAREPIADYDGRDEDMEPSPI